MAGQGSLQARERGQAVRRQHKRIAILQSNYVPWKGYFDLIASVDEFVLYDDMQYTRRDWRNRNLIKTPQGVQWLTVPVRVKGRYHQTIKDTEIDGVNWALDHWRALTLNYRKAAHFNDLAPGLEAIYLGESFTHLSNLNRRLIEHVCDYLGIRTQISTSSEYRLIDGKTERLADLCVQTGASEYVSGPSARDYIQPDEFSRRGVGLTWFDYGGYPEHAQLWGTFVHTVSILDLLFNCGPAAPRFMKYVRK